MEYAKSVIVFRQVREGFSPFSKSVGGIVRIESDGGVNRLFLSVINAKTLERGEYFLYLLDSRKKLFTYSLGVRASSMNKVIENSSFEGGFACGLVFVESDIPELVAFSMTENFDTNLCDFKKIVAGECLRRKTSYEKEKIKCECKEIEKKPTPPYDDEAVATENYFDFGYEKGVFQDLKEKDDGFISNENGESLNSVKEEKVENEEYDLFEQLSASTFDFQNDKTSYSRDNPYYDTAKEELENIFAKFPEENSLLKLFPLSRFARINYSLDKFYVVGVIKEDNLPKYICYGVPGAYSETPPKELDGYCTFIPLSVFDIMGDGFWMMFQDAITGECILKPTCKS